VLKDAIRQRGGDGEFRDWLFLALAEHRLGHADAAKDAATKARSCAKPTTVWDKAEFELLMAELDVAIPPQSN